MYRLIFIFLIIIVSLGQLKAQQKGNMDVKGVTVVADTNTHSPKKAAYMSLIIPGLGQAYNKKYWKVPIIYAGFAGLGYFIYTSNTSYIEYKEAYIARIEDSPGNEDILPQYTTENIRVLKNLYWKDRDKYIIFTIGLYAIQILDAVVDAHFYSYDISDDLSLRIGPSIEPTLGIYPSAATGIGISLNF